MKAVSLTGIRQLTIQQVADPTIVNDTDVLIRVKMVGVCGSDIHYYKMAKLDRRLLNFHSSSGMKPLE